jgi:hypothetical protein
MAEIKLETNQIYYVEWMDAASIGGEWLEDDYELELVPVRSVGFLDRFDDERIVLKQSYTPSFMSEMVVIPRAWIKNIQKFQKKVLDK